MINRLNNGSRPVRRARSHTSVIEEDPSKSHEEKMKFNLQKKRDSKVETAKR